MCNTLDCTSTIPTDGNWIIDEYYRTGITGRSCLVNVTKCAITFNSYYANGFVCSTFPVGISSTVVILAVFAFIVSLVNLLSPWTPTVLCGKNTPHRTFWITFITHLIMFILVGVNLSQDVKHFEKLYHDWNVKLMEQALLNVISDSNTDGKMLVIRTIVSRTIFITSILFGIATGPIGLAIIIILVLCMFCFVFGGCLMNCNNGSSNNSDSSQSCLCSAEMCLFLYGPVWYSRTRVRPSPMYVQPPPVNIRPSPMYVQPPPVNIRPNYIVNVDDVSFTSKANAIIELDRNPPVIRPREIPIVYYNEYQWHELSMSIICQFIYAFSVVGVVLANYKHEQCIDLLIFST